MFNEKQKLNFIFAYTSSDKTASLAEKIFNWFEPYEKQNGADLSQLPTEVLQPIVNKMTGVRTKSTELILIILKEYVKWCERNGYETGRGIFDVRIESIDKIHEQMVASPLHLYTRMNEFFDEPEKETVDIIYRVFLWMAFAGLSDKDAIMVTDANVDLSNLRICFGEHSYEIYKESKADFERACKLTNFNYEHPKYTTRRERAEGRLIMRGFRSSNVDLLTVRSNINKKLNGRYGSPHKGNMSYNRIYLSGIFYREYERERAGLGVDFSTIVAADIQRKELIKKYTVTKTRTLTTIANTMEKEYFTDYEKWKCAFII